MQRADSLENTLMLGKMEGRRRMLQQRMKWLDGITSWQIDGEKVETVADFIFSGYKITVDGDCIHEIK